jgi:hypothetical protein
MIRHPDTGKYRRTRLFVLTLGYSRKAVRLLVWQSSTQIWAELHERAFRRLGGTAASRARAEVRATEVANEGPHGLAVWRQRAVELNRPRSAHWNGRFSSVDKWPVLPCPPRVEAEELVKAIRSSVGHQQSMKGNSKPRPAKCLDGLRFPRKTCASGDQHVSPECEYSGLSAATGMG